MTDRTRIFTLHYGGAMLLTALALSVRWLLDPWLGDHLPFVTFFVAVAVAAWLGGLRPALLATLLGFVLALYCFVPPRFSFIPPPGPHQFGLAMYFMVSLAFAALGEALHLARRRAEARREVLQVTLASIGDAVIATDADGRVTFLNDVACELTGWVHEEASGRPLADVFRIVNEQTRQPVESPVEKVLKFGQVVGLANHTVLIRKDGTERPIDDSAAPIRGGGGAVLGVVLVFRDVTEKRRAEEARSRLAAIVESSDDAIVSKSLDGLITSWNAGAERLYGHPAAEVLGKPFSILVPPERAEEVQDSARRLQRGERLDHYETVRRRKDGTLVDVSVSYSPIKDGGGRLVGTAVITRDISGQKRAERRRNARLAVTQALAEAGDLTEAATRILRAVCEGLGWGVGTIWTVDRQANLIRCLEVWHQPDAPVEKFEAATRQGSFGPDMSLPGRVWSSGKPLWMADVATDERFVRRHVAAEEGLHGGFACPVSVEGEVLGVIEFFSGEIREPDPDLLEMMATLGGQIGQFIERRRAEEAARAWERHLQLVTDNAPVFLAHLDAQRRFKFVNKPYAARFGLHPRDLIGKTISEVLGDEAFAVLAPHVDAALSGRQVEFEAEVPYRDIGTRHMRCAYEPEFDAAGRVVGYVGAILDVTESNRVERALAASEQRFRTLTAHAPVGIFLTDAQGNCLFVNRRWCEMAGLSPEEAQGPGWGRALHPEDRDRISEEWYAAARAGREFASEYRFRTPQGKVTWVRGSAAALRTDAGNPEGFVGTVIDTTEQTRARAALEESERRFRQLAENIREVFWMSDPRKNEVLYVSPAYEDVWGRSCQSLYDQPRSFFDAIHPEDQERVRAAALERQSRGEPSDVEYRVVRPDRSVRWVRDRSFPISDQSGSVYRVAGIAEDITGRRETEEALRASEERFRGLMEQAPFSVQVFSADGRTVRVNRAWEELWGVRLDQIADYNILHDAQLEAKGVLPLVRRAFAGEPVEIPAIEYDPNETIPDRTRHADARRWVAAVAYPLKDAEGRVREVVLVHEDRTARIRAEEALRESEQRFRAAVGQAAVGVALVGPDNRTLFVNRGLCEMLGYTEAELLACSFADVTYPDDLPLDLAQMPRLLSGEATSCRYEKRYRHKSGSVVWADLSVAAVRGERGELSYVVGVVVDITERKKAHEALREGEERLRLALEAGRMGVWDWNITTGQIKWSDNLEPVHGLAPGTFGGTLEALQKLIHPEDREPVNRAIARSLEERSSYDIEFRNVWPDASVHWMSGKGRVFTGDDGQPARMIGVGTDITERKRAEQDTRFLADASATLAGLVDYESTLQKVARLAVPHFADWATVDVLDEGGGLRRLAVAHVDPAKVELAHELHRRFPADPAAPQGVWNVIRTGKSEIICEISDDLLVASVKDADLLGIMRELGLKSYMGVPLSVRGKVLGVITFIAAETGRRYDADDLAVAEDLAHRAAVAIENARLYQEVREADRRKDEFLAILGHELRNPLAPISNALQVLKMPGANGQVVEQAREMIERQVQHMVRLVDDLLDVSRIVRGKVELRREPVDLATVVARAVETAQPLVEAEGHELTVALPPEPLRVSGDLVRLAQVVGNLLNNAARYTERGGKLRVEGERIGDRAVLRVRDTGIGIAPDVLPKIWDMFVQADRRTRGSHGGMGIGLALVKGLVELHGGTVEARSEGPGKGSEFAVTLPLLPPKKQERPGREAGQSSKAVARRVLVVDDNVDAAESLAMLLRLGGHEARVAYDGPTALKLAEEEPPEVAFLDIGMPVMDGYELARQFRERPALQSVLLVALTGWGQEEDRRRTKEAGFDGHEVKPVSPEALDKLLGRPR